MSSMEDQLGAILGNPKMMADIMALANSMNQEAPPPPKPGSKPPSGPPPGPPPGPPTGDFGMDMAMVKALTGFARNSCIDKDQQALLKALCPFISKEKLKKLEKAMRAAKMAEQASCLLESGAFKLP